MTTMARSIAIRKGVSSLIYHRVFLIHIWNSTRRKVWNSKSKHAAFINYRQPDGISGESLVEIPGLCDKANTGFGMVDYRNFGTVSFSSIIAVSVVDDKNVIRDSDSANCAAKCFETVAHHSLLMKMVAPSSLADLTIWLKMPMSLILVRSITYALWTHSKVHSPNVLNCIACFGRQMKLKISPIV